MAKPPTIDWFKYDLAKTKANVTYTVVSGVPSTGTTNDIYGHKNLLTGTSSTTIDRITIRTSTSASVNPLSTTTIATYTSKTTDAYISFTKSGGQGTAFYLLFLFQPSSSQQVGYMRVDLTSFGAGTYTLYIPNTLLPFFSSSICSA